MNDNGTGSGPLPQSSGQLPQSFGSHAMPQSDINLNEWLGDNKR